MTKKASSARATRTTTKKKKERASTKAKRKPPIVFAGPSISHEEVRSILPHAEVRRPIRRGDLTAIAAGRVVAIVDGVFDAELAVSPRELRIALKRGVRLHGSSSMGALRSVEVPGMIGVGRVFELYRDGKIQRDDEVAILLDNETGRALTEPLVNVRFAVERLVGSGSLSAQHGEAIVRAASELHFHDRTYRNILRSAGLANLQDRDALIQSLKSFDLKREDAVTLLERLDELGESTYWNRKFHTDEQDGEHGDKLDRLRAKQRTRADASLRVWEYGEQVDFRLLLRFLAVTGKFDAYARRAVLRFLLDGGSVGAGKRRPRAPVPDAQALLETTWSEWGWGSAEEVHVTLRDLGLGMSAVKEGYREESAARRQLTSLYEKLPDALLRGMRFELLVDDLALKREAMRLGALLVLSRDGDAASVSDVERTEARRALLATATRHLGIDHSGDETWRLVLARAGLSTADAEPVLRLVALARRRGVPMLEAMSRGEAPVPADLPKGVAHLPAAVFAPGSRRSLAAERSGTVVRAISKTIGVTRIAQLSELERVGGLHVAAAYRASIWSSSVGSGKSETLEGAIAGAVMEELEKYGQEKFKPPVTARRSFEQMPRESTVDPAELGLPFDSTYRPDKPLAWITALDLLSGEEVFVPAAAFVLERYANDPFYSERLATRTFFTNGLAAGFSLTEALTHGICEYVERHTIKLAEQELSNPGRVADDAPHPFSFVDLETCPASTRRIHAELQESGYEIRVMDITGDIAIPTFAARVFRPSRDGFEQAAAEGTCTSVDAEEAVNRAILEGVQNVFTNISGAREDLGLHVRSLGRHERPRTASLGAVYWFRPWVPKRPFTDRNGKSHRSGREDLAFLVTQIASAGYERIVYCDLSRAEAAPGCVIRALIPGAEGVNPLCTGMRARTHVVRDLLRRHAW